MMISGHFILCLIFSLRQALMSAKPGDQLRRVLVPHLGNYPNSPVQLSSNLHAVDSLTLIILYRAPPRQ
jgi:hypothetical protein